MVEYSQPNTHKAFHVGHLRNTILGSSVANILEAAGHDVVRANYLGDIGWHVIKWLWCYLKFHAGEEPQGDPTRWMDAIYQEAARLVEENPEYEAEARQIFSRWDQGDEELEALWSKTRQWSLEGFQEIYTWLKADFDVLFFESDVEEPGKKLVEEMIERGLAVDERPEGGAVVTKLDELLGLDKETYRVLVILRSDGTSLYASKDLPLAVMKFEQYNLDRSIYVIDVRQSLYLRQIFKTLELLGYEWAKDCIHLSYEIVNLPGNVTMSSREGTVVLFDDLRSEAVERAEAIVLEKNPELGPDLRRQVGTQVALGAIKYPMLSVDNNKVATFDWERALDFEGQAAPYIQYAHVRANSILKRAGEFPASMTPEYALEPQEVQLLEKLAQFPGEVQRSAEELKPLILANYAYELAKVFTSFYQNCQVIKAEPAVQANRLRLTSAAKQTLANALNLLGIPAPEVM
jgi:arginyl-tRNA synthetase